MKIKFFKPLFNSPDMIKIIVLYKGHTYTIWQDASYNNNKDYWTIKDLTLLKEISRLEALKLVPRFTTKLCV